jgi:DNA-binding LacI/PurR family transcriptional regulator
LNRHKILWKKKSQGSTVSNTTLDDVAKAAGVSRASASRALNGSGPVSDKTRQKVMDAANRLGFVANQAAQALARSKANAIALVIPEPSTLAISDPFLGGTIIGISEAFHPTDYQMVLIIQRPDESPERATRLLRPGYVDGAVVVSHHRTGHLQSPGQKPLVPEVFVGKPWPTPEHPNPLYVDVDNVQVGKLATERLIQSGARNIACVAGPEDMTPVDARTTGWRLALEAAGLRPGPIVHHDFTLQSGVAAMREILATDPTIDGLFAQSDVLGAGAIQVMNDVGITVPDQVKLVAVDDSEIALSTTPRLTSVTNPSRTLALEAARLLLEVLDNGTDPDTQSPVIIEPRLVVRQSA